MNESAFTLHFNFKPSYEGFVGIEREFFLLKNSQYAPDVTHVKNKINMKYGSFENELSACQGETTTPPCHIKEISSVLRAQQHDLEQQLCSLGYETLYTPLAGKNLPLDVSPLERYENMQKNIPLETLHKMERVAATHVHIGMKNYQQALRVYNKLCTRIEQLSDLSFAVSKTKQRIKTYKEVAQHWKPEPFSGITSHLRDAQQKGYLDDLGNCHALIRISKYGTVEVRVFDTVQSPDDVYTFAKAVYDISRNVM